MSVLDITVNLFVVVVGGGAFVVVVAAVLSTVSGIPLYTCC